MNDALRSRPTISIDQNRNRIRIYKRTLHLLGDPTFIQLLVNPGSLTIVIRSSKQAESMSHRIVWKNLFGRQSCELYSKYLIKELHKVCANWETDKTYRLLGTLIPSENIVQFDLRNIQSCSNISGEHDE